jgi:type VI secretion system protein ImpK
MNAENIINIPLTGDQQMLTGNNQLAQAAATIFSLSNRLKKNLSPLNPGEFKQNLLEIIKNFENKAQSFGYAQPTIHSARYALCALLDDIIEQTEWGKTHQWDQTSLTSLFEQDNSQGKHFFIILKQAGEDVAANLDLLEILYLCITFGFIGKYRDQKKGNLLIANLADDLYECINRFRSNTKTPLLVKKAVSPYLSKPKKSTKEKRHKLLKWIAISAAITLCLISYISLDLNLSEKTATLYKIMQYAK